MPTGATTTAVPVQKTSSASNNSSIWISVSSTFISRTSFAILHTEKFSLDKLEYAKQLLSGSNNLPLIVVSPDKNHESMEAFIEDVRRLDSFQGKDLKSIWRKQKAVGGRYSSYNLLDLVLHQLNFKYNSKSSRYYNQG